MIEAGSRTNAGSRIRSGVGDQENLYWHICFYPKFYGKLITYCSGVHLKDRHSYLRRYICRLVVSSGLCLDIGNSFQDMLHSHNKNRLAAAPCHTKEKWKGQNNTIQNNAIWKFVTRTMSVSWQNHRRGQSMVAYGRVKKQQQNYLF